MNMGVLEVVFVYMSNRTYGCWGKMARDYSNPDCIISPAATEKMLLPCTKHYVISKPQQDHQTQPTPNIYNMLYASNPTRAPFSSLSTSLHLYQSSHLITQPPADTKTHNPSHQSLTIPHPNLSILTTIPHLSPTRHQTLHPYTNNTIPSRRDKNATPFPVTSTTRTTW